MEITRHRLDALTRAEPNRRDPRADVPLYAHSMGDPTSAAWAGRCRASGPGVLVAEGDCTALPEPPTTGPAADSAAGSGSSPLPDRRGAELDRLGGAFTSP